MHDESALRVKIREAIRSGRLPARVPDRMWAGPGGGADCRVCGHPVKADEIEYELEFAQETDSGRIHCHAHGLCFAALEAEWRNGGDEAREEAPHSAGTGSTPARALKGVNGLPHASSGGTMPVSDDHDRQRGSQ